MLESQLSRQQKIELLELLQEKQKRESWRKLWTYFPETGPLSRHNYPKHMEFFRVGATKRVRLALCANRVGKTETMGGYEVACHLTGIYPPWWEGRRFRKPVKVWAAGDTAKTTRDAIQEKMLGPWDNRGTGLILGDKLGQVSPKQGIANAAEIVQVKHASGSNSRLIFKSFDQRREAFQGDEPDIVWLDEECPQDIYEESLTRTLTNDGIIILTFTPLMGLTPLIESFLEGGSIHDPKNNETKHVIMASWDDAPHIGKRAKADLLAEYLPYQRDARSKGVPQLGSGAIYQVVEEDLVVPDFAIPDHWPRAYGMDVGWNRTAAVWGAMNRETDTLYLYREHYMGQAEPVVHAQGINASGDWVHGAIDPASNGRSQHDGQQLIEQYRALGLRLTQADNSVEAGIYAAWTRMASGRLKVFQSLANWRKEFRLYRRDEHGKIIKKDDHIMDATRYLVMTGLSLVKVKPVTKPQAPRGNPTHAGGWMG